MFKETKGGYKYEKKIAWKMNSTNNKKEPDCTILTAWLLLNNWLISHDLEVQIMWNQTH